MYVRWKSESSDNHQSLADKTATIFIIWNPIKNVCTAALLSFYYILFWQFIVNNGHTVNMIKWGKTLIWQFMLPFSLGKAF